MTDQELIASIIQQIEEHKDIDVEVIAYKTGEPRIPYPHSFNWRVEAAKSLRKLIDTVR